MLIELLVRHRAVILALLVFVKVQLHQVALRQWRPRHRVFLVFLDIGHDGQQVKYDARAVLFHRAVGVREGGHGQRAEVERRFLVNTVVLVLFTLAAPFGGEL